MEQQFPSLLKDVDVMRQTRASIDNASERTLNEYWNAHREVQLSEEWIGTTRFKISRIKLPD